MLLDAQNHPILVCCTSGIFQTAPLVGCLRRLQNWSLTAIWTSTALQALRGGSRTSSTSNFLTWTS